MNDIPNLDYGRRFFAGRFRRWLFSRRIMRRTLILLAVTITVIAALYAEENWRGQRAWANCKRELTAEGEVWDWSAFVPPPVPDDQNIFKAPQISEWFGDNRGLIDQPLERRVTNNFAMRLANPRSTAEITNATAAADYLAWSEQFQPDFAALRSALKRPCARMDADYSQPLAVPVPNVTALSAVVKTLVQRAKCHLSTGQPEMAWQELSLLNDLRRLVEGGNKLITTEGDWMRRELARHSLQVIAKALELHAWQEPQLLALQDRLRESDFIALHVEALKCGRAVLLSAVDSGDLFRAQFSAGGDSAWTRFKKHPELLFFSLAPRGVMYRAFASKTRDFRTMINALSPTNGIIVPGQVSRASAWWKRAQDGLPFLLRTQTLVNEAQIACALEQYRLAHQEFPETLEALVPQFIKQLPLDLINGQPLHYRRTGDGSFLLYSVGWNEKDDAGTRVRNADGSENLKTGDWIWPAEEPSRGGERFYPGAEKPR